MDDKSWSIGWNDVDEYNGVKILYCKLRILLCNKFGIVLNIFGYRKEEEEIVYIGKDFDINIWRISFFKKFFFLYILKFFFFNVEIYICLCVFMGVGGRIIWEIFGMKVIGVKNS